MWRFLAVALSSLALLQGQDLFPKHYLNFGPGIGLPRGEINEFFRTKPALTANYAYRFQRYFQADAGYDVIFGAADVRDFLTTQLGNLRIRDYQHFVTFGGRGVVPLAKGRVLFSAGGGGAFMRYQESVQQPSNFVRFACPQCTARTGWGNYALVNVRYTTRWQRVWFGVTTKVIRGRTEGDPFGGLPVTRTKDNWVNTFAEIGFAF